MELAGRSDSVSTSDAIMLGSSHVRVEFDMR